MKVKALRTFADSTQGVIHEGDVVEMPEGADWVKAGLVETAAVKGGEPRDASVGLQPVTEVHGVGPVTAEELAEYGVETIAGLASASLPDEYAEFQEKAREMLR